ncbi:MAG: VOC family protein [Gammaproteobacteria bacterium]|nr:VOC family protein [Gammaproteobacteria bacterium]
MKDSTISSHGLASFALALVLATSFSLPAQSAERPADVLGFAFIGHHVSDLEKSIAFFEAIDFKVIEGPTSWVVDEALNRLGNTPGAETRTAVMQVQSSVSDVPFNLVLRQYRGIERQDWSTLHSWDLLSSHIDLTIEGSVSPLLDKLEAMNMLVMPEVQGLPNERTVPGDFRRFAFIQDPDGLLIEYFGKASDPPAQPLVSNSTATNANVDRWGKQAGFNHYATNVIDPETAQDFYVKVFGGDYPELEGRRGESAQIMMHGWFPQATTEENLRLELIYFARNEGKSAPPIKFQDINANFAGFQVSNIETAYARAKEHGAITVTQGGIIDFHGDRAVLIRDPDVGGYLMLGQPARRTQ